MENVTDTLLAPSQTMLSLGEAAEPDVETIAIPHSAEPVHHNVRRIPKPKQAGIVLPMIPFYVRNDTPDLQEFLIF